VTVQFLFKHIPAAMLVSYDGADHCPQLQQPERFTAGLFAFIARPENVTENHAERI
jgi:pimeloyl-ACP methyl ester carboxylesterase